MRLPEKKFGRRAKTEDEPPAEVELFGPAAPADMGAVVPERGTDSAPSAARVWGSSGRVGVDPGTVVVAMF